MDQSGDHKETVLQEIVYKPTTYNNTSEALKPEIKLGNNGNSFLYFSAAVANLIAFVTGIAFGWTSPVLPKLSNKSDLADNPLGRLITRSEEAWIAGLLSLGSIFGPLLIGPLVDKIGRKKTLLVIACPMGVSLVTTAFAKNIPLFYFGRLLMGIGTGSVFTTLPMYLGEIAEDRNRGTLGCTFGVFMGSGLLFAFLVGPFLSIRNFCLVCTLPLIVFVPIFTIFIPETPQFLALVNDWIGLEASLVKLRNKNVAQIQNEMEIIVKGVQESSQNKSGIKDLFRSRSNRKGLVICLGLILFSQFIGISVVISYMQTIFEATGSGLSPEVSTIIVGTVQLASVTFTSSIVDRLGRKILLLISSVGVGLSLVGLGLYFYLQSHKFQVMGSIGWLPVASLLLYFVTFNLGFGPIPWALMAELFPPNVKGVASTLITVVCFVASTVITIFFPSLALLLGMAQSFWFFALVGFSATFFIYWVLPETKGKSWQEIQKLLNGEKL